MPQQHIKEDTYYSRFWQMIALCTIIIILFIIRLFYLQIIDSQYKEQASNNALYRQPIYPERGVIYDRYNKLLVYNEPAFDVLVTTKELKSFDTVALCQFAGVDKATLEERFAFIKDRRRNPGYSPYTPQMLLSQLPIREAGLLQEQLFRFPGFSVRPRSSRQYGYHSGALILGYMGECNRKELLDDPTLAPGDYVGKAGVEKTYDSYLRGEKGYEILLRDAVGRIQGKYNQGLEDVSEKAGKNIQLAIDIDLQTFGEELMHGKRGAIVAIEPSTGEVLALVSSPNFDPSLLTGKNMGIHYNELQSQQNKPLFNRAIMGTYPPGSTFKPAQAAMLLDLGIINRNTLYTCYGGYPLLHGKPGCHSHASPLNVVSALATSCNAFFSWGLHFLVDDKSRFGSVQDAFNKWKDEMVALGFGYKLGIDLPGEKRGYIPNSSVYDKIYKKRWNSSTIISIAIGQGEVTATPLQMANLAALIANRGYYYAPHVIKSIEDSPIESLYQTKHETHISQSNWEIVIEGMARAVTEGTCRMSNFAPGEIEVCGKTGTAENPHGKDHSAFIGFAPRYNPQIAVAVYVENGGFGATYGVPIGRLIMEYYLRHGQLSPASQSIATSMKEKQIMYINAF